MYTKCIRMPAYIGWPRGDGLPRGSEWHYKKFFPIVCPSGGADPTFHSSFRICCQNFKIRKMTKFLFLAQGHMCV